MKKKDYIFLLAMVVLGFILWFALRTKGTDEEDIVRITVDGQVYGEYPLDKNQEISIGDTNNCVIDNGSVYMKSADCPDQICVNTPPIHNQASSIICLPNRVVVEIISPIRDRNEPDAVVH